MWTSPRRVHERMIAQIVRSPGSGRSNLKSSPLTKGSYSSIKTKTKHFTEAGPYGLHERLLHVCGHHEHNLRARGTQIWKSTNFLLYWVRKFIFIGPRWAVLLQIRSHPEIVSDKIWKTLSQLSWPFPFSNLTTVGTVEGAMELFH